MKWLFLTLIFPIIAFSSEVKELSDKELGNKFVSVVKDNEIQGQLEQTSQFQQCKSLSKFSDSNKDPQKAIDCLKKQLESNKDPKALEKLAEDLKLLDYGLIQSKNVKEISNYLTNKMYKSLTGVDREEQNQQKLIESMKFKNKKMIDQKIFIEMYQSLVAKSALFEMSRFCFEDFRVKRAGSTATSFGEQANFLEGATFDDSGEPKFASTIDTSSQEKIYESITKSINGGSTNFDSLNEVFGKCFSQINEICKQYESKVQEMKANPELKKTDPFTGKACLTRAKLQEIRKAHANVKKVADQFKEMNAQEVVLMLDKAEKPQFFEAGKGGNSTLDDLTNFTSSDVLSGGAVSTSSQEDSCKKNPENPECEGYVVVDDSKEKALYDTELNIKFKKEIEQARIKEIQKDKKSLIQYLTDNGHLELAKSCEESGCPNIENEIGKIYDAKISATQDALKKSIGRRQISEEEAEGEGKKLAIQENIQSSQEERARLAQIVLFNNIITSKLTLKSDKTSVQNVSGLNKELTALDPKAKQIQPEFFSGLQDSIKDGSSQQLDGAIQDVEFLDQVLGAKPKEEKSN